MKAKDISTGMKFNSWEIINRIKNKGTIPYFVCKCDCGTIKEVSCSNLVGSLSKSCGCVRAQKQRDKIIHELDGKTFGDLTVIGFEGVDKFQKTLWKCKCLCGNFKTIPRNALVTGNTKTCGCSHGKEKAGLRNRIDISGQKFGKLTVINYSHSVPTIRNGVKKQSTAYWNCICDCGNKSTVRGADLKGRHIKSCGCLIRETNKNKNQESMQNKIFGRLTAISQIRKDKTYVWKCLCECGNETFASTNNLNTGKVQSCGCLKREQLSKANIKNISNQKFGRLVANKISHIRKNRCIWECLCECGKKSFVPVNNLLNGNTKSCGNCRLKRNSINTSYKAIELHRMLNNKGVHNYKTASGQYLDIALSYNGQKVGIEYDEWYWHGGKQEKDNFRIQKLIESGWKVIQIKAAGNLPTTEQIQEALNALNNVNHYIIQLPNWGTRKYFKQGEDTDVS